MKISSIIANVERLAPRDISGTPEDFKKKFDAQRHGKLIDDNPRQALNDLEKVSSNMQPLTTVTIVGKS